MSPRPPQAAQNFPIIRSGPLLLALAGAIAALLVFVYLRPFWAVRSDILGARQILAQGGGVELTSTSPVLPDGIASAHLILMADGRGRLAVTGPQLSVILLVNDRWWLNFPAQHRTLVGRDDLPAFDLGDTTPNPPVIPPLPRLTLDPNLLFLVMWKLPDWGASTPVAQGWNFATKDGKLSLLGLHDAMGNLTSVELRGPFPHDRTLQMHSRFLRSDACGQSLATPADFTAMSTHVEEVPTALLQKSVYGALQLIEKEITR